DTGYGVRVDNYGLLDLVFARDGEVVPVPFLIVQGMQLFAREETPFVWPEWLPPMRRDRSRAIEDAVEPWLQSLTVARFAGGESRKRFAADDDVFALIEAARAMGLLGAAASDTVMTSVAPYVYALRFAKGRRVGIFDRNGAYGASLLSRVATVTAVLGDPERARVASRWFGQEFLAGSNGETFEVVIGEHDASDPAPVRVQFEGGSGRTVTIAEPIPTPVMVSFDPNDSRELATFNVSAPAVELREPRLPAIPVIGGSAGRIALVVRDDHAGVEDADTDAARALSVRLAEQGFTPTLVGASHVRPAEYDLLHVFGYRCADAFEASLARAGTVRQPIVISPYADDAANEAVWGAAVHMEALSNAVDQSVRVMYETAIAGRLLVSATAQPLGTSGIGKAARALIERAGAAIVSCADEERTLREQLGFRGATRVVPALLADEREGDRLGLGSLVGDEPFVFVHAPLEPRCNQYLIARCCATLDYPLVMVGPILNAEYYGETIAALGERGIWVPSNAVTPAELSALYRRARIFVDASWSANGLYRLARAAAGGAALVATTSGYARAVWPGLVQGIDPGSRESIAHGLRTAWERAASTGPAVAAQNADRYPPLESLRALLGAYQAAAGVLN
ncbi:MAG: hypothetical protein JO199_07715, partial [Candidatus Eremiobacteraeota bacterium]|nr:hypothetical protein [Candidatus Eremiobacteraeota bacterium]